MFRAFLALLLFVDFASCQDICDDSEHVTLNEEWRHVLKEIDHDASSRCDRFLEDGFYRFIHNGGDDMPTEPPGFGTCSTEFPIWLNGELPTVADGLVDRAVCQSAYLDYCDTSWNIQVKKCPGDPEYYVYRLTATEGCPGAYCIGTIEKCPDGFRSPTGYHPNCEEAVFPLFDGEAAIRYEDYTFLVEPVGENDPFKIQKLAFICGAPPVMDSENRLEPPNPVYKFEFLMRDEVVFATHFQTKPQIEINEDILVNFVKNNPSFDSVMGNNLTCNIAVKYPAFIMIGDTTTASLFLGFKILSDVVQVQKVSSGQPPEKLRIQATVPIFCQTHDTGPNGTCYLPLEIHVPKADKANPKSCVTGEILEDVVFKHVTRPGGSCKADLEVPKWQRPYEIELNTAETTVYDTDAEVKLRIRLSTPGIFRTHLIWSSYTLPDIPVNVIFTVIRVQ